jgi:hypothetical protein
MNIHEFKGDQMIKEVDRDPYGCGCAIITAVFFSFLAFLLFIVIHGDKLIDLFRDNFRGEP